MTIEQLTTRAQKVSEQYREGTHDPQELAGVVSDLATYEPQPAVQHTEAKVSANVKCMIAGYDIMITVREGSEKKQIDSLVDNLAYAVGAIQDRGGEPTMPRMSVVGKNGNGNGSPKNGNRVAPTNGTNGTNNRIASDGQFACDQLIPSFNGGKWYYKVTGGYFKKYGVTVWDEVLQEAGLKVENGEPLDLTGYLATYECKEDGKPKKVTRLQLID